MIKDMNDKLIKKIERLWGTPIFFIGDRTQVPKCFGSFPDTDSPFVHSTELVTLLTGRCEQQLQPVVYKDENRVYFCCIKAENGFYLTGPVCTEDLNPLQLHSFYKQYGVFVSEEKHPAKMSLYRILTFVSVMQELTGGGAVESDELMRANALVQGDDEDAFEKEATILELKNMGEEFYHHTYQDERYVMDCIREGNEEATLEKMEGTILDTVGILSLNQMNHYRYLAVIMVAMATREAIAGGVSPSDAYRMSDLFINKIDRCATIDDMMKYMKAAGGTFARKVAEVKAQKAVSNYTEQCKDYIYKNFHNKIYLEDIAAAIGVSPGHLSRVFRTEMGMSIQDYIQKFRVERAANLLKYSEASLSEISHYACFHSQSHFGSVFKRYTGMTPRQYRDRYKEKEFRSKNGNDV
jgi:AraC-like DNA-binding protein